MLPTLLCFSHLRWDFVYQRPQHLMTRFAQEGDVLFIEEPLFESPWDGYKVYKPSDKGNLKVLVPRLPSGLSQTEIDLRLNNLLLGYIAANAIQNYMLWYYSPMALSFTALLAPIVTIYDCMDELSAFKFAPLELREREAKLFSKADVVFTGGRNLYAKKKDLHNNIHPFPSSIDRKHFAQARNFVDDPIDQLEIPHPRIGFYGVLDERLDIGLVEEIASIRPEWQIVLVGPIVKIHPDSLPRLKNIHYLGSKSYKDLPAYLAGWDIAFMPFALNESTEYISPTKTPEFLAGGKRVISTPIVDVVNDYGNAGLVAIAATPQQFVLEAEKALSLNSDDNSDWSQLVDSRLENDSWDNTWQQMVAIIQTTLETKTSLHENYLQTCSITL